MMAENFSDGIYSKRVLVKNMPFDINKNQVGDEFEVFGNVYLNWSSNNEFDQCPINLYLQFEKEISVHKLIEACVIEDDKYFFYSKLKLKNAHTKLEIEPFKLSEAEYIFKAKPDVPTNYDRAVYITHIKGPMTAERLSEYMEFNYGNVVKTRLILHKLYKCPTDSAVVEFDDNESYYSAISEGRLDMIFEEKSYEVRILPYLSSKKVCRICCGLNTNGEFAPFYCAHRLCMEYQCQDCLSIFYWQSFHLMVQHGLRLYNVKTKKLIKFD